MGWHTVLQGETASSIADFYSFQNYKTVYEHPQNEALRTMRRDPDILFPGDRIYIPQKQEKWLPAVTDRRHKFVMSSSYKVLRLRLQDFNGNPFVNAAYRLQFTSSVLTGKTDKQGILEQRIPVQEHKATLRIGIYQWDLNIGHLNPVENTADGGASGIQQRLCNLGFDPGAIDGIMGPRTRAALQGFQKKHPPLTVNGVCDAETLARLIKEHGS